MKKNYKNIYINDSQELSISKLKDNLIRVPITKIGEWEHPIYGTVKFSQSDFQQVKNNFNNNVLGFESYATYGHPKEEDSVETIEDYLDLIKSFDGERKKGDLKKLFVENNILYGDYLVNDETYKDIENGEFDYASGEFLYDFLDKNTGKNVGTVLLRTALTNAPFIPLEEKIKVLSTNLVDKLEKIKTIPHSTFNYSVKLSIDSINNTNDKKSKEIKDIKDETISTIETVPINSNIIDLNLTSSENENTLLNNKIFESNIEMVTKPENNTVSNATPDTASNSTTINTNKLVTDIVKDSSNLAIETKEENKNSLNIPPIPKEISNETKVLNANTKEENRNQENLINNLVNNFESKLEKISASYDSVVKTLTDKIETLNQELLEQKNIAYKFSQNLSEQDKRKQAKYLFEQGVSPALIQRYSLLADHVKSKKLNVPIKLSTKVNEEVKEVDSSILNEIESLLIDACKSNPVEINLQRFGQSTPPVENNIFQNIIQSNLEKAKTLKKTR